MNKILCTCLVAASFLLSLNAHAADAGSRQVTVKLNKIQTDMFSERSGDEVYFSVTEYKKDDTPKIYRVPMLPLHWVNKDLPTLSDVTLWAGTVTEQQPVMLVISLLEQDLHPWDPDDHLGSIQLRISFKGNKLETTWSEPDFIDQPYVTQPNPKEPKFIMLGSDSKYMVAFSVE